MGLHLAISPCWPTNLVSAYVFRINKHIRSLLPIPGCYQMEFSKVIGIFQIFGAIVMWLPIYFIPINIPHASELVRNLPNIEY